ncbi:MAG: PAS domain S-box protein, partial [Thermoplasmata archaeon]|nr:PAS domain S-box protein [Thermoplasmata archaeon]
TVSYNIANTAVQATSLDELYQAIHDELSSIMDVRNFYISLYDVENEQLLFPYYEDDNKPADAGIGSPPRRLGKGLTEYVLKHGKGTLLTRERIKKKAKKGEIEIIGTMPRVWVGAPLKTGDRTIGVISAQSYTTPDIYSKHDLKLLEFISGQIAVAIERKRVEAALRESEEEFRLAFENAKDAIFWADVDTGIIVNCNKSAELLMEKKKKDMIGQHQRTLHPPKMAEYFEKMFEMHVKEKGAVDAEAEIVTGSGKLVPVHISSSVTNIGGRMINQGIFRDITHIKEAREEIQERERKYRQLVANAPIGVIAVDTNGNITEANPLLLEILGSPSSDATKAINVLTFPLMVKAGLSGDIKKCLDSGKPVIHERPYTTAWEKALFLRYHITPLRDGEGNVTGVQGLVSDVTKEKENEKKLREFTEDLEKLVADRTRELEDSEGRYRLLAETVEDVIWIMDLDLNFTYISPSVERLRGFTVEEAMSQSLEDIFPPESMEIAAQAFFEEVEREKGSEKDQLRSRTLELETYCKDGSTVWTEATMNGIYDNKGSLTSILGVTRNIADRKGEEKLAQQVFNAMEHSMVAIATLDLDLNITYANRQFCKLAECSVSDAIEMKATDLIDEEAWQEAFDNVQVALEGGKIKRLHMEARTTTGKKLNVEVGGSIIYDDKGKPTGVLAVITDIGDRKR